MRALLVRLRTFPMLVFGLLCLLLYYILRVLLWSCGACTSSIGKGQRITRNKESKRQTFPSSFMLATACESFCCTTVGGGGQRKTGFETKIFEMRFRAMKSTSHSLHFSSLWGLQKANAALGPPTTRSTGLKSASMRACMTGFG